MGKKCISISILVVVSMFLSVAVAAVDNTEIENIIRNAPTREDYPDAGGVIIKSETVCDFTEVPYRTQVNRICKIFNERGIGEFSEIKIRYDEKREEIELLKAYTIKPDGEVIEVDENAVHNVTPPELTEARIYSHIKDKVINFPGLEPDSIIVCSYLIKEIEPLIEGHFWYTEQYGYTEPIEENSLTVKVPDNKDIYYQTTRGDLEPEIETENGYKKYTWKKLDIPAVTLEVSMPPLIDIVPVVRISTFQSWQEFSDWYSSLITDQYKLDGAIRDKINELTANGKLREDKVKALYNYVATNIRYVGLEFGIDGFKPHKSTEVFKNKYGDCKDKATLLIAMLGEIGVQAEPVLIGTGGYFNLEIASPEYFDHMIVYLPEEDLYLDPTSDVTMFGNIPAYDQGKKVLIPTRNKIVETPLAPAEENCESIKEKVTLAADGSASINISWYDSGVYDFIYKNIFKQYSREQQELVLKQIINSFYPNGDINRCEIKGVEGLEQEFNVEVDLNLKNYGQIMGNVMTFKPFMIGLNVSTIVGPEKRDTPLYIGYKLSAHREIIVDLPEGYVVNFTPESVEIDNEAGTLKSTFNFDEKQMHILLDLKTKMHIVELDKYEQLRDLFNKATENTQQQVMIGKK